MTNEYDLFISYARKDDVPDSTGIGWVTAIKQLIEQDSRAVEGRQYRIFFDTHEIASMQDWRARILGALRTSKVLLVCLSPNYFASDPCHWEWDEYRQRETRLLGEAGAGEGGQGTVASVFFVDSPGTDPDASRKWRDEVMRRHHIDLRPWFPYGARALRESAVTDRVRSLGQGIWQRLEVAERLEAIRGNLVGVNPYFVGRADELEQLDLLLHRPGSIGAVTVLNGPGGLGKTELAVQYAHIHRGQLPGGVWMVRAEGQRNLLEVFASLASEPAFGFRGDPGAGNPEQVGRAVLQDLLDRASSTGGLLVILDNVSEPALLSEPQLANLPKQPRLSFLATSRLGEAEFPQARGSLLFFPVGPLPDADALALIRDRQPERASGLRDFADEEQESAAREIIAMYEGITLAVEQTAIYLGANGDDFTPSMFLRVLREHGQSGVEGELLADETLAASMRHRDKALGVVLDQMVGDLSPSAIAAMHAAALLVPDAVPWPWLKDVVSEVLPAQPGLMGPEAAWGRIKRVLSGRRLLNPTAEPDVARIHRLYRDHLAEAVPEPIRTAVRRLLLARCEALADPECGAPAWEYEALLEALALHVADDPALARSAVESGIVYPLAHRIRSAEPRLLAVRLTEAMEAIASADADDLEARMSLALSHQLVSALAEDWLPDRAVASARRSVEVLRTLVSAAEASGDRDDYDAAREFLLEALIHAASNVESYQPPAAMLFAHDAVVLGDALLTESSADDSRRNSLRVALIIASRVYADHYPVESLGMARRALRLAEELQDDDAIDSGQTWVGRLLAATDPQQARGYLRQALEQDAAAYAAAPHDRSRQWSYASALMDYAGVVEDIDPRQALELREQALPIYRRLSLQEPDNVQAQNDLAGILAAIGDDVSGLGGNQRRAAELFEEAIRIRTRLAADDPQDLMAKRSLAIILGDYSLVCTDQARADQMSWQAMRMREELLAAQPGSPDAMREAAVSCNNVAHLLEDSDPQRALALAQRSVELCEEVFRLEPESISAMRDLIYPLDTASDILRAIDPPRAVPLRRRAIAVLRRIADAEPDDVGELLRLSQQLRDLGIALRDDRPQESLALLRESVVLGGQVVERDPADWYALHETCVAEVILGDVLADGSTADAYEGLQRYVHARDGLSRLITAVSDDDLGWRLYAQVLGRVGSLVERLYDQPTSTPYWRNACDAFAAMERAVGVDPDLRAARTEACGKARGIRSL